MRPTPPAGSRSSTAPTTGTGRSRVDGWGERRACSRDVEECAAHGWLVLDGAVFAGDRTARACAASALTIAKRFGDADLEFDALALLGETYVASGRVAEGMPLRRGDGRRGRRRGRGAWGRRRDLLPAAQRVRARAMDVRTRGGVDGGDRPHVAWTHFVRPTCRTHYGGILVALGRWTEAEAELLDAIETSSGATAATAPPARAARRPARAPGPLRGGRAPARGGRVAPDGRDERRPRSRWRAATSRSPRSWRSSASRAAIRPTRAAAPARAPPGDPARPRGDGGGEETLARLEGRSPSGTGDKLAGAFAGWAQGEWRGGAQRGAPAHLIGALETFSELNLPHEAGRARGSNCPRAECRVAEAAGPRGKACARGIRAARRGSDADAAAALLRELGAGGRAWPRRPWAAHEARVGGAALLAAGSLERGDRRAALHQPAHGGAPRGEHPLQARAAATAPRPPPTPTRELPEDR